MKHFINHTLVFEDDYLFDKFKCVGSLRYQFYVMYPVFII